MVFNKTLISQTTNNTIYSFFGLCFILLLFYVRTQTEGIPGAQWDLSFGQQERPAGGILALHSFNKVSKEMGSISVMSHLTGVFLWSVMSCGSSWKMVVSALWRVWEGTCLDLVPAVELCRRWTSGSAEWGSFHDQNFILYPNRKYFNVYSL